METFVECQKVKFKFEDTIHTGIIRGKINTDYDTMWIIETSKLDPKLYSYSCMAIMECWIEI